MILNSNPAFEEPDEVDMSGLRLVASGWDFRTYTVESIRPASPAAGAGIQAADVILEIDGRRVTVLTLSELRARLRRHGRECSLILRRGDKTLSTQIKLERQI